MLLVLCVGVFCFVSRFGIVGFLALPFRVLCSACARYGCLLAKCLPCAVLALCCAVLCCVCVCVCCVPWLYWGSLWCGVVCLFPMFCAGAVPSLLCCAGLAYVAVASCCGGAVRDFAVPWLSCVL